MITGSSLHRDREALAREFGELRIPSPQRFRARSRELIRDALGPLAGACFAPWLELVGSEFLLVNSESCSLSLLVGQLLHACALAANRPPPENAVPFPGAVPGPYWEVWASLHEPPPLQRSLPVVPVARLDESSWSRPEYDTPSWDPVYKLAIHITHIGDFDLMDLYPVPGVDPAILREPSVVLDHRLPSRPPMGLAVALLLLRQIAYDYAAEHGRHDIARWIFARVTGQPPPRSARAPSGMADIDESELARLPPDATRTFCEQAFAELDALCGS